MFYKKKYNVYLALVGTIFFGGALLTASHSLAADVGVGLHTSLSESSPLSFSFSIAPVTPSISLSSQDENQKISLPSSSNTGFMVNTVVESVGLKGGLSYFSGKGSPVSSLDNFSAIYSFNGWNKFESILVVPNELSAVSSTNLLGKESSDNHLQAVSLYGGYDLTPSLKIKGAFLISKSPVSVEATDSTALTNSSYSWWLDFGGDYKLNEKMTYTVNFGYYDSGEINYDSGGNKMIQGSVYLFNNQLNMSF